MRGRVLDRRDLQKRADDLRRWFAEEENANIGTSIVQDEEAPSPPPMDARERKWAAAKLLRPVDADMVRELGDLSAEEVLAAHEEYWAMTVGVLGDKSGPARLQRMAAQYAQTKAFVCQSWGMRPSSVENGKA